MLTNYAVENKIAQIFKKCGPSQAQEAVTCYLLRTCQAFCGPAYQQDGHQGVNVPPSSVCMPENHRDFMTPNILKTEGWKSTGQRSTDGKNPAYHRGRIQHTLG